MRKYILDFIFDEFTGQSKIVLDFNDDSMSILEINQAVMEGEIREEITMLAGKMFGEAIEQSIRNGKIELICLDNHPEEREGAKAILQSRLEDVSNNKRENLI